MIALRHKIEFGKHRFYPENALAALLLNFMNRRTFTLEQVEKMREYVEVSVIEHV